MKKNKPVNKKKRLPIPSEKLLYRVMPHIFLELLHKYFRLEVTGTEHLPKTGPVIITPNHSGYSGFDALLLTHEIHKATGRRALILAHHFWFINKITSRPAQKFGFIEASTKNGLKNLRKKKMIILFPEGEIGNFKPSTKAYSLQEFKRGFVRMALSTGAPIVPTLVIGAEESHINLAQLKLTKYFKGMVLPVPLNLIPLPSKWKIIFLPPVYLPYKTEKANNPELVHEVAEEIQEKMQERLNQELSKRTSAFF